MRSLPRELVTCDKVVAILSSRIPPFFLPPSSLDPYPIPFRFSLFPSQNEQADFENDRPDVYFSV